MKVSITQVWGLGKRMDTKERSIMGNTFFYKQVENDTNSISWKDIFSECRKKHTRKEFEMALMAGSTLDDVTEENMLEKWQKPWIFYPMLKGGLLLILVSYVMTIGSVLALNQLSSGIWYMTLIIPPIVVPFILMVFIWELNIPKNISFYELLAYFVLGGLFSFAITTLIGLFIGDGPGAFSASYAAFREEPAKLLTAVIFLILFQKNKKVYGLTGLVIGAAVGAGFGAFESVAYAMDQSYVMDAIENQIMRGVFAIGGHVVYSAPYVAALTLAMKKREKLTADCFLDKDFLMLFAASVALHFLWNTSFATTVLTYMKWVGVIVLLWIELLYILKKCLHQVIVPVEEIPVTAPAFTYPEETAHKKLVLTCTSGSLKGAVWQSLGGEVLHMGREEGNELRFPSGEAGISRKHCTIQYTPMGWTVRDANSSYGTYVNESQRLTPGVDQVLNEGDMVYLGSRENAFRVTFQ